MTASVGQALPGLVPARADQPATKGQGKGSDFGDVLHGAGKAPKAEKQPAADAAPRGPRWAKFAQPEARGEPADAGPATLPSQRTPVAKAAIDDADAKQDDKADAGDDPKRGIGSAAPLQDRLPLMVALHDLRRFSTPAAAGGQAASTHGHMDRPTLPKLPASSILPEEPAASARSEMPAVSTQAELQAVAQLAQPAASVQRQQPIQTGQSKPLPGAGSRHANPPPGRDSIIADASFAPQNEAPSTLTAVAGDGKRHDITASLRPAGDETATDSGLQSKPVIPRMTAAAGGPSAPRQDAGRQTAVAARADIVAQQSFPAPAAPQMSPTASALAAAIASGSGPDAVSAPAALPQTAPSVAVPTHVLKIELHPAELGMVTASLRLVGEQLSIELKPETHEAHRRLSSDSDAIVKSLRGLGFDVDKVTVMQPSIAAAAPARVDSGGAPTGSPGRDQPSFQSGNSSGNGAGAGGQNSARNRNDDASEFGRGAPPPRERAGGDLFI